MTTTPGHGPSLAGAARWAGMPAIVTSVMDASLSMKLGEPLRLGGQFSPYGRGQPGELLGEYPSAGERAVLGPEAAHVNASRAGRSTRPATRASRRCRPG